MSAEFIVLYAGQPMGFGEDSPFKTQTLRATRFVCEPDAWLAVSTSDLIPHFVEVLPLSEALKRSPVNPR